MKRIQLKKISLLFFIASIVAFQSCKNNQYPTNSYYSDKDIENKNISQPNWLIPQGPYQESAKRQNDIVHMKLEVSFDWKKQYVYGKSQLIVTPFFHPQNHLILDAKGFDIEKVELRTKNNQAVKLDYKYDSLQIDIALDRYYNKGEEYIVEIAYTAKPNALLEGGSDAITSDKGLYFVNPDGKEDKPQQIWTQGETQASSCWFPIIDRPNEKITQEIYITIEERFTTLSNGLKIYSKSNNDGTKTEYWKQDKPHAPYLTMLAIGEYAVVKESWKGIEVSYYVEPKYEEFADDIFGNTPEMMEFFSNLLDYPYPWDKYAQVVVRDFVSGAMENTSATVMMQDLQSDDRQLVDKHWDAIIAHELFHHWFGDLVTCESWANLPLNESFANYSEFLWDEYKYGVDEAEINADEEMQQYFQEARNKREPLVRFNYFDQEEMFDTHSYNKGGRILHMLRNYLGDEVFFKSLNLYLKNRAYKTAEIHDLRLACEEVSGEDLNWFFNQWILARGHPSIIVSHEYFEETKQLILTTRQVQDLDHQPLYKLPLKIDYWVGDKKIQKEIVIEKEVQDFYFDVKGKPSAVLFDADQMLLADIQHEKALEEFIYQYEHAEKYKARYLALEGAIEIGTWEQSDLNTNNEEESRYLIALNNEKVRALLIDALDDSVWAIRYNALAVFENYNGEGKDAVNSIIESMAKSDEKSMVMADAILLLSQIDVNKYKAIFKAKLGHKSYKVESEALKAYMMTDAKEKDKTILTYKDAQHSNIQSVVAGYFAEFPKEEYDEWFINKINDREHVFYDVIVLYGEYLKALDNEEKIIIGLKLFEEIARDKSSSMWNKLASFQAINVFNDRKGIKKIKNDIIESETDASVKNFYLLFR